MSLTTFRDTDFLDYVFVPGGTRFDVDAKSFYANRNPRTIELTGITNLADFFQSLIENRQAAHPIRHIIVCCHASTLGLLVRLDGSSKSPFINFIDLLNALTSKSILIQPETMMPRPIDIKSGKNIPPTLYIKGCNIGSMRPYLEALKAAIGSQLLDRN